jgi:esterase/lipase
MALKDLRQIIEFEEELLKQKKKKIAEMKKLYYKKFKDYYNESEEFRKKHIKYMTQKVNCIKCGQMVARSNMTKHQKTKKCNNKFFEIARIKRRIDEEKRELINKKLDELYGFMNDDN